MAAVAASGWTQRGLLAIVAMFAAALLGVHTTAEDGPNAGVTESARSTGMHRQAHGEGLVLLQAAQNLGRTSAAATETAGSLERKANMKAALETAGALEGKVTSLAHQLRALYNATQPMVWPASASVPPQAVSGPGAHQSDGTTYKARMVNYLIAGSVYILFGLVVAVFYRWSAKDARSADLIEDQQDTRGFQFGLFDTRSCDLQLCLYSFCCLCVRWPATVSADKLKLIGFWPAFFLFSAMVGFSGVFAGLLSVALLCICIFFRQRIRAHYDLDHGTWSSILQDCCVWTFCMPCAGAQEARQVDYVKARG